MKAEWGALLLGCGRGALRLEVVQPPGGKPMAADAYLRGHPLPKLRERPSADRAGPGARLRDDPARDLRARRPHRARLPRGRRAPRAGRPRARPGAAPRLRRRAAPRHRRRGDRAPRRALDRGCSTRPCSPRCASASTSCSSPTATPDHAAVDQAVELVKSAGAAHAAGLSTRSCAAPRREREELTESLLGDDSTPEAAAVAHSAPLWLARMWWEELGPDAARSLLAACNEPAELALRVNTLRRDREAMLATLREAGVDASAGRRALAAGSAGGDRRSPAGPATRCRELVAAGELTPQSRGSAAVVEVLDPQPGEHVLDLCAGPGIKTGQIAARMGDRGEVISVELDPARAAEVADQARRLGLRSVTVIEADAAATGAGRRASTGSSSTRPARTSARSPRAPTRAGASRRGRSSGWSRSRSRRCCGGRRGPAAGRHARLLDLHDLPPRERGPDRGAAARRPPGEVAAAGARRSRRPRAGPRLAARPRCLQLRPDRDRTTGFFICRLSTR